MTKSIIILGDSTSMTIGADHAMYPFKLAEKSIWADGATIINCSLPGFTSADACRFFFEQKHAFGEIKAVIIYLGNCDTMATELPKHKFTPYRSILYRVKKRFGQKIKKINKTKRNNKFLYFEWNDNFDQSIETEVPVSMFEYNISRVLDYCERKTICTVLVRPEAHVSFPAGSGKGNFVFYNYLGMNPRLSHRMTSDDSRLIAAAKAYEEGDFSKSADVLKDMLLFPFSSKSSLEYQTLLVNNYATCQASLGAFEEAEYLLQALLNERDVRREIVLYNLSMVSRMRGDEDEFSQRFEDAYEADGSMYRIRESYKNAVDRLASRFKGVKLVDMREIVHDEDFVDHCHPLPYAQDKIADEILKYLDVPNLRGDSPMDIQNILFNPEYSLGNDTEFYRYFNAYSPISDADVRKEMHGLSARLKTQEDEDEWPLDLIADLPRDMASAFMYYQRHPVFPSLKDAVNAMPGQATDFGRFPELFVCRFMVPFLRHLERSPKLNGLFSQECGVLRRADQLLSILPADVAMNVQTAIGQFDASCMRA